MKFCELCWFSILWERWRSPGKKSCNCLSYGSYPIGKVVLLIYLIQQNSLESASGKGHEDQKRASIDKSAVKVRPRKCEFVTK